MPPLTPGRRLPSALGLCRWLAAAGVAVLGLLGCGGPQPVGMDGAAAHTVTVVAVHDGDTLRVRDGQGHVRTVRLATIDAPELGQPFGTQARDALRAQVLGRTVTLQPRGHDRYGRTLAVLWLPLDTAAQQDVALWAVGQGLAWHYTAHAREQPVAERWHYAMAEALARASRLGLWAQPNPQPPWAWRRAQRAGQVSIGVDDGAAIGLDVP